MIYKFFIFTFDYSNNLNYDYTIHKRDEGMCYIYRNEASEDDGPFYAFYTRNGAYHSGCNRTQELLSYGATDDI